MSKTKSLILKGSSTLRGFYGNHETQLKSASWELLYRINQDKANPWCVIGDFNEILHQDEKQGCRSHPRNQMTTFKNALEVNGLFDIGCKGSKFTWSN